MPRPAPAAQRRAVLFAVSIALAGCSLDYGSAMADDLSEEIPDTVVVGIELTVVENGSPRFRIEAERGESYQSQKKMKLEKVRFTEFAPGGRDVSTEGTADSAVFFTDTESAQFSGDVRLRSAGDGVTVESGYLEWDGPARLLTSRAETVTTLSDDDGTSLSGSGFGADAARRSFSFGNRASGRFVSPEKAE